MKKSLLCIVLSIFSLSCYAGLPTVLINKAKCMPVAKGNLTGCINNKTKADLSAYELKETMLYKDGASETTISNMAALTTSNYSVVTTSSEALARQKVLSLTYAVIQGDAQQYRTVPGCQMEFTPNSISKPFLTLQQGSEGLYCK